MKHIRPFLCITVNYPLPHYWKTNPGIIFQPPFLWDDALAYRLLELLLVEHLPTKVCYVVLRAQSSAGCN